MQFLRVERAAEAHVFSVAANLRPGDRAELAALGYEDPEPIMQQSLRISSEAFAVLEDGGPIAVFGVSPLGLLGEVGVPWMLATPAVARHRRAYARLGPAYTERMLSLFPRLLNVVHARNTVSVAWLRRLGFSFGPEFRHGPRGEPFYLFEKKRDV